MRTRTPPQGATPAPWDGRPQRRLRQQIIQEEDTCSICHRPVNKELPGNHPWGPSIDHRVPRSRGGTNDRENLALAHFRCNSGKKDRPQAKAKRRTTSRQW